MHWGICRRHFQIYFKNGLAIYTLFKTTRGTLRITVTSSMSPMASQITGVSIVYSLFVKALIKKKHQSFASLAFVRRIALVTGNAENVFIWWRHHDCHFPRCNRQRVGRRVICQTKSKTGLSWGETDQVFHYWQYMLQIQCFSLALGPSTSTVNIMRYLQPWEVAQAAHLLQDGSSVRLVARRFVVSLSVISRACRRFRETGQYSRKAGQGRSVALGYRFLTRLLETDSTAVVS